MIKRKIGETLVSVSLLFPAAAVVMITLDPSGLAAWCLLASMMHEFGHMAFLVLLGARPRKLIFGMFGMRMETDAGQRLSYGKQALILLAGPLVNGAAAAVLWCGGVRPGAMVHTVLCLFNLLPIEPLDGGQILQNLLSMRMEEETACRVVFIVSMITVFPLTVAGGLLLAGSGYNFTLLSVCLYLLCLLILKKRG